eukprot:CAMPEP_0203982862 /NCGR_PEP_ID=MMETSP0360-20130528/3359_1 /ASSEMBLY_ACC=CAM_ASM_000342 /TAXON_ID=268821 /ORGANISM="Scrippsiella Hangoei, Strain SHTV-5" /LENGTH=138 /DNA_ID=CAMNT_0050921685 /DNA_START=255 /DNA_END=667 /DNA_ORIENTATION=-
MAGGSSKFQSEKTALFFQDSLSPSSLPPHPQQEITASKSSGRKSAMASEVYAEMSMPTSFITMIAPSLTAVPPTMPADATPTEASPRRCLSHASAICERHELWLQRNITFLLYFGPQVAESDPDSVANNSKTLAFASS